MKGSYSTFFSRFEDTLFIAFLGVLAWAPLPFASNRVWAGALLFVLLASLFCAWLGLAIAGKASLSHLTWARTRLPLGMLLLVQAWVWLQIQYLPRPLVEFLSPQAYAWNVGEGWLSISLDREFTKYYLLRGGIVTLGFMLSVLLVNSPQRVRILLQVLVFSGTCQALYGSLMLLSGLELGFFVEKYVGRGVATGTFVNRNHLAGYLVMCLSCGVGLLISQLAQESGGSWRERARRWLKLMLSSKVRLRIYLAIMVVALVLTRSRMGNIAFFASLSLAGVIYLLALRRIAPRLMVLLGSLLLIDLAILGRWFGLDLLVQRLEQTNPDQEARVWSNEYTLQMIRDFPLTGSGGGSFYGVFPNYQGTELEAYHIHAHNDYLEFAAELGLPITAVLGAFLGAALYSAYRVLRTRRTPIYRGAAFACLMTLGWAFFHSSTDFNLQIPANALTFVVILSMAFTCRALPGKSVVRSRA